MMAFMTLFSCSLFGVNIFLNGKYYKNTKYGSKNTLSILNDPRKNDKNVWHHIVLFDVVMCRKHREKRKFFSSIRANENGTKMMLRSIKNGHIVTATAWWHWIATAEAVFFAPFFCILTNFFLLYYSFYAVWVCCLSDTKEIRKKSNDGGTNKMWKKKRQTTFDAKLWVEAFFDAFLFRFFFVVSYNL